MAKSESNRAAVGQDRAAGLRPTLNGAVAAGESLFDFKQRCLFPSKYLNTFYLDRPPTNDEKAVLAFVVKHLKRATPVARLLEVGCGPTIHHTLPFVPHASEIHMADYLPDNLQEIERWRNRAPGVPDWRQYTALVLELENGAPASNEAINSREAEARARITALLPCDLRQKRIMGSDAVYPAVAAFYCTEEVGLTLDAWTQVMTHLARVVAPGGHLYLACLRGTGGYRVGDEVYPCGSISEQDVKQILPQLGFDESETVVEGTRIAGQEEDGVLGVILAAARKRRR